MHRPLLLVAVLGAFAPAQAPLLLERIEAPMLYVTLQPGGKGAALQRVLADPGLAALLEMPAADGAGAFQLLKGLLLRASGDLELALLGIAPPLPGARSTNRPLLVLRARLPEEDAGRMRSLLEGGSLAEFHRESNGHRTFHLRGQGERPDFAVEVAVVGSDLVAANDAAALSEVLGAPLTDAALARTLAHDVRFIALRERLQAAPGSVLVYGDWPRLGRRLQTAFGGLPGFLIEYSGLGGAQAVMVALQPREQGLHATALLEFAEGQAGRDIDGWLTLVQARPARSLVAELPAGGLGGIVLAVDPAGLGRAGGALGPGGLAGHIAGFRGLLSEGCRHRGLDFERQVLSRLGRRGGMQFLLVRDGEAGLAPAYAFAAKNRKSAQDLIEDVGQAVQRRGLGRVIAGAGRNEDQIEFALFDQDDPVRLGAVDDSIVFAFHPAVLHELRDEMQRGLRTRSRRDADVMQVLQALEAHRHPVAGVFALDLRPLLERTAARLGEIRGGEIDLSGVPSRYVGFLDLQPGRQGAPLLRIQLLCGN